MTVLSAVLPSCMRMTSFVRVFSLLRDPVFSTQRCNVISPLMGMLTVPSARFSTSVVGSVTAIKGVPDVVKLSQAALSPAVLISLRPVMVPDPLMRVTSSQSFTPFAANLLQLAKGNKSGEIEQIARNLAKEKGIDFDTEFNNFKKTLGL